jgi:O-antigen/teichoic acid export membrane protein
MSTPLARPAGAALGWRALELGGVRLISLVRFFILAKLLVPEDFGLLAIAAVAVELSLALTDLGLIPSLIQHRAPDARLYDAAWTVELIRACIVAGVLMTGAPLIAEQFGDARAAPILRGLSVATFIASLSSVRTADFVRELRFAPVASLELSSALVEAVVSIALARVLGVWALVVGQIAAAIVRTALSWMLAPYKPRLVRDLAAARPLLAFGRWMLVTVIVYTAGDVFLRAVVSRRLGTADLGRYFVSFRLAMLPKQVMSDLVQPVAFPLYARLQESPREAAEMYRATILAMAVVLVPVYALLATLTPSLVSTLLGARWAGSEAIIRILSGAAVVSLFTECTIPLVTGLGRPHFAALVFGVRSALVVALVWWLAGAYGVDGAALAWLLAEAGVQVVALATAARAIPKPFARWGVPLGATVLVSGVSALAARAIDATVGGLWGVLAATLVFVVLVVAQLGVLDRRLRLGFVAGVMLVAPRLGAVHPRPSTRGPGA